MNTIRLTAGETWAIGSNRYVLDQVMGNGLLHLRCERTGAPLQVRGDQNDLTCPSGLGSWSNSLPARLVVSTSSKRSRQFERALSLLEATTR